MIRGSTNVGSDSVPHQSFRIVPEFRRSQWFHSRPNPVEDRTQTLQRHTRCRLKLLESYSNGPALGMPKNDHQPGPEVHRSELDTRQLRRSDDISSNADDKEIAKPAIKDDLRRHPRIGTPENDGERLLAHHQLAAARWARIAAANAGDKAAISLPQTIECVSR
jgi:hypothetical protein